MGREGQRKKRGEKGELIGDRKGDEERNDGGN